MNYIKRITADILSIANSRIYSKEEKEKDIYCILRSLISDVNEIREESYHRGLIKGLRVGQNDIHGTKYVKRKLH